MTAREIIMYEAEAIMKIPADNDYKLAATIIHQRAHIFYGKAVLMGIGKAGQIALNIATTLSSTGTPAVFLHPAEAVHGDMGMIQQYDVLILISNSGITKEIVLACYLVKKMYHQMPIILITGTLNTELCGWADCILHTGNPLEVCPFGLTPTTSTTVMTVIGDIIVNLLMQRIEFTREDYYKRHHGGYIGNELNNNLNKNG